MKNSMDLEKNIRRFILDYNILSTECLLNDDDLDTEEEIAYHEGYSACLVDVLHLLDKYHLVEVLKVEKGK